MFWHKDAIEGLGYESVDDFAEGLVVKHNNCCFRITPDGVYFDYDIDSDIIDKFNNIGCTSFRFTEEEWEKILEGYWENE